MSTGSIEDRPRTGCPKVYSQDHVVFIDECMVKNDELTTRDLADKVKITFSDAKMFDATIVRIRKELGWMEQNISTLLPINKEHKSSEEVGVVQRKELQRKKSVVM